jgi:hypothetical protein
MTIVTSTWQTFSGILMDAKLERSVVIQGFMIANHEVQKSGKGFGKAYWGNKWRFKIFDGFYTHPKDPATGKVVDVVLRFYHLMQRLEAASKGEDTWLNKQFETDEEMKKEVSDTSVVEDVSAIPLYSQRPNIFASHPEFFFVSFIVRLSPVSAVLMRACNVK